MSDDFETRLKALEIELGAFKRLTLALATGLSEASPEAVVFMNGYLNISIHRLEEIGSLDVAERLRELAGEFSPPPNNPTS